MKRKVILNFILIMLFFITTVYAHKPIFETKDINFDKPITIKDHTISYAVYGSLERIDDVDFIKFYGKRGEPLFIQMTVPIIKGNEDFSPSFALMGKGIKGNDEVPFDVPDDFGVIVVKPSPKEYFYEKFTQTKYYIRQTLKGEIPEDGDYYVAVFADGQEGKYALAVGEEEKFTILDWIKMPVTYIVVKYFFNPVATVFALIIITLIIYYLIRRWRIQNKN